MSRGDRIVRSGHPTVRLAFTGVEDGDLRVDLPDEQLEPRRRAIAPTPWTWLHQVHGSDVVTVTEPGGRAGADADAAVTVVPGATLAVHTADCAPVLFDATGPDVTAVGAAHAGWRGIEAGVLERTVTALRALGATDVTWYLGPCISPAAYEFGRDELDRLAGALGSSVVATTSTGAPALDLRAAVAAALAPTGAVPADASITRVPCTAADPGYFSWRARSDRGRQAGVIVIEPASGGAE